jgi:hypothetical protein
VEKFFRWLELLPVEEKIAKIKSYWADVEKKEPKFRRFLHLALEEIKRNPSDSEKLIKILLEEVKEDGNKVRELSYVHNRADGAGV